VGPIVGEGERHSRKAVDLLVLGAGHVGQKIVATFITIGPSRERARPLMLAIPRHEHADVDRLGEFPDLVDRLFGRHRLVLVGHHTLSRFPPVRRASTDASAGAAGIHRCERARVWDVP
jgi:hypothetical protein